MNNKFEEIKCDCGKKTVRTLSSHIVIECKGCGEILFNPYDCEVNKPKKESSYNPEEYEWMDDVEKTIHLDDYYPKKHARHENHYNTQVLIKFKSIKNSAVIKEIINVAFMPKIADKYKIRNDVSIAIVPPSYTKSSNMRLKILVEMLCDKFRCLNASDALVRIENVPDATWRGCFRTKEMHLQSIACNNKLIKHRKVLLIDDITTHGHTLNACKEILLQNGAKSVKCLVLGKTKRD